jgi:hypothetical protein
MLSFNDNLF